MRHPLETFIHEESFPTVWCPGCGIGTAVQSLLAAMADTSLPPGESVIFSGSGCTHQISNFLTLKTRSVPDGRVIDAAVCHKRGNPRAVVIVFLNNGDLFLSGAEDLLRLKEQPVDMLVLHINNLIYAVSRESNRPMTPFIRKGAGSPPLLPFNIPLLARKAGASFTARWTPLRAGWLKHSLVAALRRPGLSLVEILSPCLIYDSSSLRILDASDRMTFYDSRTEIRNGESLENLDLRSCGRIFLGEFYGRVRRRGR